MMKTKKAQTKQNRIEDLTLRELDMVYSLVRVWDWPDSEIGRVYKLSVVDVHKVFDNYPQLREEFLRNPPRDMSPQAPESELTTKTPRKRRSDARFATTAERQAAYRARLKEKRHADMQQLPASSDTNSRPPADPELIDNALTPPFAETDSQCAETELLT
jgi:hypothetical protein